MNHDRQLENTMSIHKTGWTRTMLAMTALTLVGAAAPAAEAYTLLRTDGGDALHWDTYPKTLYVPSADWDDPDIHSSIQGARDAWLVNPSNFYLNIAEDDDGWSTSNGENEVAFIDDPSICAGPGKTLYRFNTGDGRFLEADIVLNATWSWGHTDDKHELTPYGGAGRPAQTTLIHEMGHVAGLGHEPDVYNIMGQDWDHIHVNDDVATAYVGEDAGAGVVAVYGEYGYMEDLGVVHWKRSGASGSYSTHSRTLIYDESFSALPSIEIEGEPYYELDRGSTYYIRPTLENNGGNSQCSRISLRMSTNAYITTFDTEIRDTGTRCLSPDTPYTGLYSVTIPAKSSARDYWIGVIIDADNDVSEHDETNNATYITRAFVN